ncbi:MAG: DUF721 domain-containing protein [Nitrospira sp.]|nr:DUF721 domain-containing protein [Nitrospira sp.]
MHSLDHILQKLVRDLKLEGGLAITSICNKWTATVGDTVAKHTWPDSIRNKVLTLIVDTPQWMHQLSFYKDDITEKVRKFDVDSIRFRIGKIPKPAVEKVAETDKTLTPDDLAFIENTISTLKDSELQEQFRKLLKHGLTRKITD